MIRINEIFIANRCRFLKECFGSTIPCKSHRNLKIADFLNLFFFFQINDNIIILIVNIRILTLKLAAKKKTTKNNL